MVSTRRRKSSDRRGSNVSSGNPRAARDKKKDAPRLAPEEMEDAIEAHYRNRARALDGSDASDTSGASDASDPSESSDEEVLGFGAAGGVDSEEDDASASSSDLDSEEEMERNTRYGQLLKQAKAIKAKLDIERGERSDSDLGSSEPSSEEDEGADELDAAWGSRKGSYYNADNVDMEGSEEEEDLEAEEKEATRLQKEQMARLGEDDYGSLSEDEDSDDENGGSDEDDEHGIVRVDDVLDDEARDLRASAVRQDALELKALLQELRSSLSEIRGRLGPLLQEVKSGEIATAEGVSYLEAKHLLLMHYVAHLVFYLLLKAEGKSVKDHPVIARLIEIRSYLEKTRPIDKKLKYQIEKLLVAADATRDVAVPAKVTNDDLAAAKPRPGALMVDDDDDVDPDLDGAALNGANPESGTYRPPRLNPVSMELDETDDLGPGRLSGKDRRRQLNASRKASRSQYIQEFAANLAGAPEERKMGMPIGMDTADALRQRQKLEARAEVEEELMIRVPLSKDERKKLKAQRRAGLSGKALLDDFQDDLADLVNGGEDLGVDARFSKHKTSQLYGADLSLQSSKKRASGDADIPERASLTARRANMDGIRAKQQHRAISYNMGEDHAPPPTETDFYRSSKKASESRKQQKRDSNAPDALLPPMADPTAPGARRIGSAIEKNRGLTPHRKKDLKNPRKKHRIKFAEAKVRRSGQVQKVVDGAAGAYEGERTGIKSSVSKSVKF